MIPVKAIREGVKVYKNTKVAIKWAQQRERERELLMRAYTALRT